MTHKLLRISLLLLSGLLTVHLPVNGQTMALARQQPKPQHPYTAPTVRRLPDVLNELKVHYKTDILFEDKTVSGLTVPSDLLAGSNTISMALSQLLKPFGLRYKQVKPGTWLILNRKSESKSASQGTEAQSPAKSKANVPESTGEKTGQNANVPRKPTTDEIQDITIAGQVVDVETKEGLPGVSVVVKGTNRGTTTDATGKFQLAVPSSAAVLVFSYVGYDRQELSVADQSLLNVALRPSAGSLSEVVVVGYGTVKKSDLTGSVAQVQGATIKELPIASVEQGLQGRAPGVQVVQTSGQPGAGLSVRIRGASSIAGGNEPLYVIDGFPLFNSDTRTLNGLASINPGDIQSIEVLKDASATAIYGSRGANGVVIITTKTAKENENRVEFSTYYGVQRVRKTIDLLDARGYAELANAALVNDGKAPLFDLNNVPASTDWQNEIFRDAPIQNYDLSYAGGSAKSRFVVAGNYFNQEGIVINSNYQRGSLRFNLNNDISKRVKLQTRLLLSRSAQNGTVTPNGTAAISAPKTAIGAALIAAPTIPVFDANGNYSSISLYPFSNTEGENPVAVAQEVLNRRTGTRILGGLNLGVELLPGLINNLRVGIDYSDTRRDYYVSRRLRNLGSGRGDAQQGFVQGNTYLIENTLTYNRSFGSNNVEALAGYGYQQGKAYTIAGASSGFISDDLQNAALQAGSTFGVPNTSVRDSTLLSWFGRVRLNLRDKYLFTVSGRSDGASVFSQNNKWGFFPSAAVAWRVSQESFLVQNKLVSNLKLRASWGQSGNPAIPAYLSLSVSNPVQTSLGEVLNFGLAPARLANPNLKWETTTQVNVGLDVGLWQERLQLTVDYYVKNTKDLLATVTLPASSGFSSIVDNVGASRNEGIELGASYAVLSGNTWTWTIDGNFAANRNRITRTKDGKDIFGPPIVANLPNSSHIIREGEPLAAFYGTVFTGLNEGGLYQYRDQNNDGVINANDRVVLGKAFPDFFYGFNSRVTYKGLDLSVFFQGVSGVDIINQTTPRGVNPVDNTVVEALNFFPKPGADYQKPSIAGFVRPTINPGFDSRTVEDGSYLRLRNIKLAYNLPVANWNIDWMKSLQVYVSGQNLLTFTRYSGYDPEVNSFGGNDLRLGVDFGAYPAAKSITTGLKVEF